MTILERVYRVALALLPADFRGRYHEELLRLFRLRVAEDARRSRLGGALRAVAETWDVLLTSYRLRRGASPAPGAVAFKAHTSRSASYSLFGDLRLAARTLSRRPVFALTSAGTLAVGIGSVTAIFAVVDAVLLRPLPYRDPERLVMVWREIRQFGFDRAPSSLPDLVDWASAAHSFEQLAGYTAGAATLQGEGGPERVQGSRVTGNLFATLGAPLQLGRPIEPSDDRPDAERVVVLSYGLWQRRFGGDASIVGSTTLLGSTPARVVGVTQQGFDFPGPEIEFWLPLAMDAQRADRDTNFLQVIGRLRAGATLESARDDLVAVAKRVQEAHPGQSVFDDLSLEPRHAFVVANVKTTLLLLSGAVLLLFLLSCVNFGNLLLVRAVSRRRELAVRAALGAPMKRLHAPLLTESLLVSLVGGALGLALAWGAARLLLALEPGVLPRRADIAIDARVFLFATGASVLCALACGGLPAWSAARRAPGDALQDRSGAAMGRATRRLQGALVTLQVASAVTLLVGAGLLARSFYGLVSVPTGFEPRGVLTAQVPVPPARYPNGTAVAAFYDELLLRLRDLPGVDAVGATWALPFSPDFASSSMLPEGADKATARTLSMAPIRGDYFRATGMTVLRGRELGAQDGATDPPVAVVNEALAALFWPGQDPIGKRFVAADPDPGELPITVVGVVADIKRRSLDEPVSLDVYLPHDQTLSWGRDLSVVVHTEQDPEALVPSLREAVWSLDATLPITRVATLSDRVSQSVAAPRFRSVVLALLAASATLLSAVGLYGVLSYVVSDRRRDLAVRSALGAGRRRIVADVVASAARLTGIGALIGMLGAAASGRVIAAFLFQVEPLDPVTFAAASGLLFVVALIAAWIPARRAAGADPASVLQSE